MVDSGMGANTVKRIILAGVLLVVIVAIARMGRQAVEPPPDQSVGHGAGRATVPPRTIVPPVQSDAAAEHAVAVPRPVPAEHKPHRAGAPAEAPADAGGNADTAEGPLEAPPEDIPSLAHIALTDPDVVHRTEAVNLLAATEDPEAIPYLHQALSDPDAGVRRAVVDSLAELDFPGDAPVELLSKVVTQDPDSDNRFTALQVLAETNDTAAAGLAQKLLDDPDVSVRTLAERIVHGEADTASEDAGD